MESGIFYPGKDWAQQKSLSFLFIYLFVYLSGRYIILIEV